MDERAGLIYKLESSLPRDWTQDRAQRVVRIKLPVPHQCETIRDGCAQETQAWYKQLRVKSNEDDDMCSRTAKGKAESSAS